jgi:hypothetical protein
MAIIYTNIADRGIKLPESTLKLKEITAKKKAK